MIEEKKTTKDEMHLFLQSMLLKKHNSEPLSDEEQLLTQEYCMILFVDLCLAKGMTEDQLCRVLVHEKYTWNVSLRYEDKDTVLFIEPVFDSGRAISEILTSNLIV